ncbi:myb-related transcription factor, partner of profilin-like [Pleurodeles waltl]|uniref:myb-related transcription factor, partner of profilin-like n=1 Tax=Pleurodeles waltl TaxID=8319 RepID=UPI0037093DA3
MIPSLGVILNLIKIQKLSAIVDNLLTNFTGATLLIDTELAHSESNSPATVSNSVKKAGLQNHHGHLCTGKGEGRKERKLKFSEQELEVLTEEVVKSHDSLFGKSSLQVPESKKRRLWADIQTKICAVGVAQRSVQEIKKRWYDLRSRAKERVARRLQEARSTGDGPPTETPSTPMEDLVESTLLPEEVSGVTDIDTSGTPSTSKGGPGPAASASAVAGDTETHPASDSNTSESQNIAPIRYHYPNLARTLMTCRMTPTHLPQVADALVAGDQDPP